MTVSELIQSLSDADCPAEALVLFCVPDEDTDVSCLEAYKVQVETAHDDDCSAFIRVYLEGEIRVECEEGR